MSFIDKQIETHNQNIKLYQKELRVFEAQKRKVINDAQKELRELEERKSKFINVANQPIRKISSKSIYCDNCNKSDFKYAHSLGEIDLCLECAFIVKENAPQEKGPDSGVQKPSLVKRLVWFVRGL